MKILKTSGYQERVKQSQKYDPNSGEMSDDLGLSPEFSDPANIEDDGEEMWTPESITQKKGPGIYYSITDDIPEGPFKSVAEAKSHAEQHIAKYTIFNEADENFWYEETIFYSAYSYKGWQLEYLGNFNDVDVTLTADLEPTYTERGHDPQGLMSE